MESRDMADINVSEMLLNIVSNTFSDNIAQVKNLLATHTSLFTKESLEQSLLLCCQNGNIRLLPSLVKSGVNLEITDDKGNTPLLLSVLYCHVNCAQLLVDSGANVNAVNLDGNTALIISVCFSSSYMITRLLIRNKHIATEHVNNNGYTALFSAVESINLNAIKLLIDSGANSTVNYNNSLTSLTLDDIARRKGILDLVKYFKIHKETDESLFLLAALQRDLDSINLLAMMDETVLNQTSKSSNRTIVHYLTFVKENIQLVNERELETLKMLLKHSMTTSREINDDDEIMQLAVSVGNQDIIEVLSSHGFITSNGILTSAIHNNELVRFLLTVNNVHVNKLDKSNQPVYEGSALERAMQSEFIDSAKYLIEYGAYLNVDAAMKFAVEKNHENALKYLLSNFKTEAQCVIHSSTLLHVAVKENSIGIIKDLLDNGADIDKIHNGKCPLTSALDINVIELLLSRGADVNRKITGSWYFTYPLHEFLSNDFTYALRKKWVTLNVNDSDITTSFVNNETEEIVKCLLRHGAHIDSKDSYDRTPLDKAARRDNSSGIMKILIKAGSDVKEKSLFHDAVENGCIENVKCLIDEGADVDSVCEDTERSAIFSTRDNDILELLLDNDADIDINDNNDDTVLSSAMRFDDADLKFVKCLVEAGCDINHKNAQGYTALMYAARNMDFEIFKYLVTSGANVNCTSNKPECKSAMSILLVKLWNHVSVSKDCISLLLDHGVSVSCKHSGIIHVLISSGVHSLIPKLISLGLCPVYLQITKPGYAWYKLTTYISPLVMALLLNQSDLAEYFINIKFLMRSDILILSGNRPVLKYLSDKCLSDSEKLLSKYNYQPLSLETLCLILISDILGTTSERKLSVTQIGLLTCCRIFLSLKVTVKFLLKT